MKAYYSENLLIEISEEELQLLKAGAKMQAESANTMRNSARFPETREIWEKVYNSYQQLISDIDEIIESMPF